MRSEVVLVTPDMAQKWLSHCLYDGQRTIRPNWVGLLSDEMRKGSFVQGTAIRFEDDGAGFKLVDGMHRLSAVVLAGLPQQFVAIYNDVAPSEEIAMTYGMLDIGLRRTWADMSSALHLGEEIGLNNTQMNALGAAVLFIYGKFLRGKSEQTGRKHIVELSRDYGKAATDFFDAIAGSPSNLYASLRRAATMSVALVTFRYSHEFYGEEKIVNFWRGVALDDGIKNDDPRKIAHLHLLTSTMPMGGSTNQMRSRVVSPSYSARYIANCFNAYTEGRTLMGTKVMDATAPIRINGSPFTGKE